ADDACRRVLGIGEDLLRTELDIVGPDRLARARAECDDQPVVRARRRRILAVGRREPREPEAETGENLEQTTATAAAGGPPRSGGLGHDGRILVGLPRFCGLDDDRTTGEATPPASPHRADRRAPSG